MIMADIKLSDIAVLNNANCKIKDPSRVERTINHLAAGGIDRLQIVTDFDFTVTKHKLPNGEKVLSSFGILEHCQSLPEHFRQKSLALNMKYRPIEIDPRIKKSEKIPAMIEWWTMSSELLKGFALPQDEIESVAERYTDATRDGCKELFDKLCILNVPILVFSAGLGDSVKAMLKYSKLLLPNVKVVSNFLLYKDGLLNGLTDPIIHVFNKNESALANSNSFDRLHDRNNIILMGDSLGDAEMADGCVSKNDAHILKIGFLTEHIDLNLPAYMDAFDVVLLNDNTMNVARAVLDIVC